MSVALIIGITGQDGSYLAELLLGKGYGVHGIVRRCSSFNTGRIDHVFGDKHNPNVKLKLHYGDVLDPLSIRRVLGKVKPNEVYNLAAQSQVRTSFEQPVYSAQVAAIGALHVLEAVRDYRDLTHDDVRFYQAGSSEMFGGTVEGELLNEASPFRPRSPYACAKVYAHWQTVNYREAYGLFACNGVLFNHESPRRGETFVTRKITRAATRISLGLQNEIYLGNLDAKRDWGFAGDYVDAMWRMLQCATASDYVIATGECHSVKDWAIGVFEAVGASFNAYYRFDERYLRPTEVDLLIGDATRARNALKWEPQVDYSRLMEIMVEADHVLARKEQAAGAVRMENV